MCPHLNIVFDRPPGPEAPRFIEVEDDSGKSVSVGEWRKREDGLWALRIPLSDSAKVVEGLREARFEYLTKFDLSDEELNNIGLRGWELVSKIHHNPYEPPIGNAGGRGGAHLQPHDEFIFKRTILSRADALEKEGK